MTELEKQNKEIMENPNKDIENIFNTLIKEGVVEEEKEITKGFTVKLKVLDTGELMQAEAIMNTSVAPKDIVARVRAASILSQAMTSLNGDPIEKENMTSEEIRTRRIVLYRQILKLPSKVVQDTYQFYISLVQKQEAKYSNLEDTMDQIENF